MPRAWCRAGSNFSPFGFIWATPNLTSTSSMSFSVSSNPSCIFSTATVLSTSDTDRARSRLSCTASISAAKDSTAYLRLLAISCSVRLRVLSASALARRKRSRCSAICVLAASSSARSASISDTGAAGAIVSGFLSEADSGVELMSIHSPLIIIAKEIHRINKIKQDLQDYPFKSFNPENPSCTVVSCESCLLIFRSGQHNCMGLMTGLFKPAGPGRRPAQGGAQKLGGDVHDRDHLLEGHACRADDAERADHDAVDTVRRRHHAAFAQRRVAGFGADEDFHATGAHALVQQMQQVALGAEGVEQQAQLAYIRQVGDVHQIGLAADHELVALVFLGQRLADVRKL